MKKMLKVMPHAQANVEVKEDGTLILTSYNTKAAVITPDGWLSIHCWVSPTTRRHIAAFMDEYIFGCESRTEQSRWNTGSYQTAKSLYESGWKMNVHTGEVIDVNLDMRVIVKDPGYFTEKHNRIMDMIIRGLDGVTVSSEEDNTLTLLVTSKAAEILDHLYDCDMIYIQE